MLINVKSDVDTFEYRLSSKLYHDSVNSSEVRNSQLYYEADLTGREDDEFRNSSDISDTHNFILMEDIT